MLGCVGWNRQPGWRSEIPPNAVGWLPVRWHTFSFEIGEDLVRFVRDGVGQLLLDVTDAWVGIGSQAGDQRYHPTRLGGYPCVGTTQLPVRWHNSATRTLAHLSTRTLPHLSYPYVGTPSILGWARTWSGCLQQRNRQRVPDGPGKCRIQRNRNLPRAGGFCLERRRNLVANDEKCGLEGVCRDCQTTG